MSDVERFHQMFHTTSGVVNFETVRASDYDEAQFQRKLLEATINAHNAGCQDMCGHGELEADRCGYRPYFLNNGRRCTTCPVYDQIDFPQGYVPVNDGKQA